MKLDSSDYQQSSLAAHRALVPHRARLAAKGVKVAIFDLQAEKGEAMAAEIGGVFCEVNVTERRKC